MTATTSCETNNTGDLGLTEHGPLNKAASSGAPGYLNAEQATDILRYLRSFGYLVVFTNEPKDKAFAADCVARSLAERNIVAHEASEEIAQRLVDSTWQLSPPGFTRFCPSQPLFRKAIVEAEETPMSHAEEVLGALRAAGIVALKPDANEALLEAMFKGDISQVVAITGSSADVVSAVRGMLAWVTG